MKNNAFRCESEKLGLTLDKKSTEKNKREKIH